MHLKSILISSVYTMMFIVATASEAKTIAMTQSNNCYVQLFYIHAHVRTNYYRCVGNLVVVESMYLNVAPVLIRRKKFNSSNLTIS